VKTDYDILIVGGGLVGASLAAALRDSPFSIGVIEAVPLSATRHPSYDERMLALAYGSKQIFESIDCWREVAPETMPIEHIHVSDRGHFGTTRLSAAASGLPALGFVTPTRALGAALYSVLQRAHNIDWLCPASMQSVDLQPDLASLSIRHDGQDRVLTTRLVVAADGTHSAVRKALGIESEHTEYRQSAIVTTVTAGKPHHNTAYERFTESGPLAFLPLSDNRCAVVWTARSEDVDVIMALDELEFLAQLQQRFGNRLGPLSRLGRRVTYPLSLARVNEHVRARLALIGNAAHTVHPVAGQGFNLGLRDVAAMAEILTDAVRAGEDIGQHRVLSRYADWRTRDNRVTSGFTNGLIRIFSNNAFPITVLRNAGLIAVDLLPGVKRRFVRVTSGLAGRLPRLARGLPL